MYFHQAIESKIALPEISLSTQDFTSLKMSAQGMTCLQRRFGQAIRTETTVNAAII
jgi:hypothetical protein